MMAKKMKGFMCHSLSSTSVCMPQDRRFMIVDQVRLVENAKYVRAPRVRRPLPVSNHEKKAAVGREANATTSLAISDTVIQVVVMRVSIHCEGCAGKVKKHLSGMEGVTSFRVDLETKRVTVTGHVSQSGVLESISKVKKAELWPSC